jgi:hypothetical protein
MDKKVIRHPELDVEAEVVDESVPGWLEVGWELKDDGNVEAEASTAEAATTSAEKVEES